MPSCPHPRKTPDLKMTGEQLANFYADLCNKYPLITIEDPFDQDCKGRCGEVETTSQILKIIGTIL
jgi:enolase